MEKTEVCKWCNFKCSTLADMINHRFIKHNEEVSPCELCNNELVVRPACHFRTHHFFENKCSFCTQTFVTYDALYSHEHRYHRQEMGMLGSKKNVTDGDQNIDLEERCKDLGLPTLDKKLIPGPHYVTCYDIKNHNPLWVFESITKKSMKHKSGLMDENGDLNAEEETNLVRNTYKYQYDPELNPSQVSAIGIRFLRQHVGHLAACANHMESEEALESTFLARNLVPMLESVNVGSWNSCEHLGRKYTKYYERVDLISGPVYSPLYKGTKVPGLASLREPEKFFKIIRLNSDGKDPKVFAFMVPNKVQPTASPFHYRCTLESIEEATGLRFYSVLSGAHEQQESNVSRFRCAICYETFITEVECKSHLDSVHKKLKCRLCPVRLETQEEIDLHIETHRIHLCARCPLKFYSPADLKNHELTHDSERKLYKCSDCDKQYKSIKARNLHHRTIHQGISFSCDKCEKVFMKKVSLMEHLLKVHGDTSVVGKPASKYTLTSSSKGSTAKIIGRIYQPKVGRPAFKCSVCGELFVQKHAHLRHVKRNHRTQP